MSAKITYASDNELVRHLTGWTISWYATDDEDRRFLKIDATFVEGERDINIVLEEDTLVRRLSYFEDCIIERHIKLQRVSEGLRKGMCDTTEDHTLPPP